MKNIDKLSQMLLSSWKQNKTLTLLTVLLLIGFVISAVGAVLDPTIITGAPRWLKPMKFAISVAIYTGTLIWLLGQVTVWPRLIRWLSVVIGWLLLGEVALIDLQAARGVTSHFNVSTAFDRAVFGVMGLMIFFVWNMSLVLFVALCRQRFESRAWGTALRAGVGLSVLGSGIGALMLRPTPVQLAEMKQAPPATIGAHTVGGQDGGPGLPVTGWSTQHGDLRTPHFIGLHGMQAIPLFAWLLRIMTGWSDRRRVRFVLAGSFSYLALFLLTLTQALSGYPSFSINSGSLVGWAVWLALSAAAFRVASLGSMSRLAGPAGAKGAQ